MHGNNRHSCKCKQRKHMHYVSSGSAAVAYQWSRNDIHIGGAKRGVIDCFYDFGVKSHKFIY